MEITKIYKACVKAAKFKGNAPTANRILPTAREKKAGNGSFNKKAIEVITNISKLRDFLFTYQTEYLGEFSPLVSISSKMTEEEREQIDADAQTFIKTCSSAIASLKTEVGHFRSADQYKEHSLVVLEILDVYLKDICKLYSQQRAFRVKQAVDRKRMSRLKPEKSNTKDNQDNTVIKGKQENKGNETTDAVRSRITSIGNENTAVVSNPSLMDERKPVEEIHFTREETQLFEEENERLYEEMNNVVKEIKNIEGKVVEISQLQEVFQEKVLSQADQIESINETAVSTTENVKDGNEQIREAIKNSATFRVWILFFLVMCTFSLLFLDWYND